MCPRYMHLSRHHRREVLQWGLWPASGQWSILRLCPYGVRDGASGRQAAIELTLSREAPFSPPAPPLTFKSLLSTCRTWISRRQSTLQQRQPGSHA